MANAGRLEGTYTTAEAASQLGISKSTLLRWFNEKRIQEVGRDRRGWRVFTKVDVEAIRREML